MPLRHLRVRSGLRGIPAHGAFLLRLTATFVGALVVVGSGLYAVQAHDARQIVIADGAKLQLARGQLVEDAYKDKPRASSLWARSARCSSNCLLARGP